LHFQFSNPITARRSSAKRQKIAVMLHPPSVKAFLVGTPFEAAAQRLRWLLSFPKRYRHPELWGIYLEEEQLPQVLRKLLKPDSSALDVGAHIGSFTSLLLQIAPKGRHVAIEASPSKAAWLRKRFHNVDVHSVAASDANGTATFQEDTQLSGFSRLSTEAANDHCISYTVETCRLDSLLSGRDLDLIKIDVEGLELSVLRGATETIKRCRPPIIFECGSEYALIDQGISRRELFDFLTGDLNYSISTFADFLFGKGGMEFDEFRRCGLYPFLAFNFVAVPLPQVV
jgi:FkbM family methyltransferase